MSAKYTGGPWEPEGFEQISGSGNFYGGLVIGDDDVIVAQCVMPHNVSLIAAAPDLLEALQDLFDCDMERVLMSDGKDDQIKAISKARAAIVKATGEEE